MVKKEKEKGIIDGKTLIGIYEDMLEDKNLSHEEWTFDDFLKDIEAEEIGVT